MHRAHLLALLALPLTSLAACEPTDPAACLGPADCPSPQTCLRGRCVATQQRLDEPDEPASDPLPDACGEALPPRPRDLVVHEVLAAVPPDLDVNGDGLRDAAQDEFVELVNLSGAPLDLRGLALQKGEALDGPSVPLQTPCLLPGEALVVFGGLRPDAQAPRYEGAKVEISPIALRLPDGGGVVRLRSAQGQELHALRYEPQRGASTTLAPERTPHDRALPHTRLNPDAPCSPGACASGRPFASGCPSAPLPSLACADAPAPRPGDLMLHEVLSAVPSEPWGDVNGDGQAHPTRDEFLEIVSLRHHPLRLEGLRLWKDEATDYALPDACLDPLGAWLILGAASERGALPVVEGALVGASERAWSLRQGGNALSLRDAQGLELWREVLPQSPRATSLTRARPLDPSAPWVPHEALAPGAWASPGRCALGAPLSTGCPQDPAWEPCDHAPPARPGELLLHELLLRAPAGEDFNGDGRAEEVGEGFVELWVSAEQPVWLDGLRLEVDGAARHHLRGCVAGGAGLVVFDRLEDGAQERDGAVWAPSDLAWAFPARGRLALVGQDGEVWDEVAWDEAAWGGPSLARTPEADSAATAWEAHPSPRAASPGVCASGAPLASGCRE